MNIFDHLIKDTEIIGISDLNASEDNRGTTHSPYTTYSFSVYTKNHSILIVSPEFSNAFKEKKDNWIRKYLDARSLISKQIGEIESTE